MSHVNYIIHMAFPLYIKWITTFTIDCKYI